MSFRADKLGDGPTEGRIDGRSDGQMQATTIPEGQNWPRVKMYGPESRSSGGNTMSSLEYTIIIGIIRHMMASSNGNIFFVTGPLCGEFTGHRAHYDVTVMHPQVLVPDVKYNWFIMYYTWNMLQILQIIGRSSIMTKMQGKYVYKESIRNTSIGQMNTSTW